MNQNFDMEAECARLRAALSDCNRGLNEMAGKLVAVGVLVGFTPDQSKEEITSAVRARLASQTLLAPKRVEASAPATGAVIHPGDPRMAQVTPVAELLRKGENEYGS